MERWEIVLLSLGWFLIYEGFLPAFFPDAYRAGLERVREMDDKGLQIMGGRPDGDWPRDHLVHLRDYP